MCLLFSYLEAIVDESPSEVIQIDSTISVLINGSENARQTADAEVALVKDLGAKLLNKFLSADLAELLDRAVIVRRRRQFNSPLVFRTLESVGAVGG